MACSCSNPAVYLACGTACPSCVVTDAPCVGNWEVFAGTTMQWRLDGLRAVMNWSRTVFVIGDDPLVRIVRTNPEGGADGLTTLNGEAAEFPIYGAVVSYYAEQGRAVIQLEPAASVQLEPESCLSWYFVVEDEDGGVNLLATGNDSAIKAAGL